jgi:primosomal protein N' (replication factor Y)
MNKLYCEIVFDIPTETKYVYLLPSQWQDVDKKNLLGRRVMVKFHHQKSKVGIIVSVTQETDFEKEIFSIDKILDPGPMFKPYQLSLAEKLAQKYLVSVGEILYQMFPFKNKFSFNVGVVKQNVVEKKFDVSENVKMWFLKKERYLVLQPDSVKEKFGFYKDIIFYSINENKECIIIFPDNFFLEDFYEYLTKLYPELVGKIFVYNGKLSVQERFNIWGLVYSGEIKIVLSTRIGIFLPCEKDGVIVVDEPEHIGHKNFTNPIFSVTDILNETTFFEKIFLTSFNHSVNTKFKYKKGLLKQHYKKINTNISFVEKKYSLKNILIKEIYKLKQAIIIFPKKGYATVILCTTCGKVARCEKCNSVLNYDDVKKNFFCPMCNNKKIDFVCSKCKSKHYKPFGVGIQKISNYLSFSLPEANVARLDNDLTEIQKNEVVKNFNNQKIDVLVSTQEILSYIYRLNFTNVSLIYFAKLELMLFHPNYLAYENCYNFIHLMNLLTNNKSNIYLELEKKDDNYKSLLMDEKRFYLNELKIRKELCYPPYCEIIQLTFISKKQTINKIIDPLISELEQIDKIAVFSTKEIIISKSKFKFSIIVKVLDKNFKLETLLTVLKKYKDKEMKLYIDYDPKDFL